MRRALWSEYFFQRGPRGYAREGKNGAREALRSLLDEAATATRPPGLVSFVGAGPGDPELLTLKARNRLHEADIVVHEKHVIRLKSGDPAVFGRLDEEIEALEAASIPWEVVPGITAAAGAAADMGVSLTRRGRNSELRLITARDVDGFAEHDWAALARPGSVAAIYMGKRAIAFLRGRLLMRGAAPSTPLTIVGNASRQDKRIVATTLLGPPDALDETHLAGPAVLMLGILPRAAMQKAEAGFEVRREAV